MGQMFLATVAGVLLIETGISIRTVIAASLATGVTVGSRWLFRRRKS